MLVIRKIWCGFGTALSKRKSVQPSTKTVGSCSSSATGPRAGVLPLEMIPVNQSIPSESFRRRSSLTFASVPAASSALTVSILRLPRKPPCALISSAARMCPLYEGSPSTAAGPVKNVMCPNFRGLSEILPFAGSWASAGSGVATPPAAPAAAAPTVTPKALRKSRRLTSVAIVSPPSVGAGDLPVRPVKPWNTALRHGRLMFSPENYQSPSKPLQQSQEENVTGWPMTDGSLGQQHVARRL